MSTITDIEHKLDVIDHKLDLILLDCGYTAEQLEELFPDNSAVSAAVEHFLTEALRA